MTNEKGFSEKCVDRELDGVTLRELIDAKDFTNPLFVNVMRNVSGVQAVTRILSHMKDHVGNQMSHEMTLLLSTILPVLTNASCAALAVLHAAGMQDESDMDFLSIRSGGPIDPVMMDMGHDIAKVIGLIDGDCVVAINEPIIEMYVVVPTEVAGIIRERSAPVLDRIRESELFKKYQADKIHTANLDDDHPVKLMLHLALMALQAEATRELEPMFNQIQKEHKTTSKMPSFVAPSTDTVQ